MLISPLIIDGRDFDFVARVTLKLLTISTIIKLFEICLTLGTSKNIII